MNLDFVVVEKSVVEVLQDGKRLALIHRGLTSKNWRLTGTLCRGTLTRMKREAIKRWCSCGDCPK